MIFVKVDQDTAVFSKTNCTPKKCSGDCNNQSDSVKTKNTTEKTS